MSDHKLVPTKAIENTLGECEVKTQSLVCEAVFRCRGHFLYSSVWHTDYNVMLLMSHIASDVWTQAFSYLRFLTDIKLSFQ